MHGLRIFIWICKLCFNPTKIMLVFSVPPAGTGTFPAEYNEPVADAAFQCEGDGGENQCPAGFDALNTAVGDFQTSVFDFHLELVCPVKCPINKEIDHTAKYAFMEEAYNKHIFHICRSPILCMTRAGQKLKC